MPDEVDVARPQQPDRGVPRGGRHQDRDDRLVAELERAGARAPALECPDVLERGALRRCFLGREERAAGSPAPCPPERIDRQQALVSEPADECSRADGRRSAPCSPTASGRPHAMRPAPRRRASRARPR